MKRPKQMQKMANISVVLVGAMAAIWYGGMVISSPALAQSPSTTVVTMPSPRTTAGGNASSTIGTGGTTFQLLFAGWTPGSSTPWRTGCIVQNNGTHTMWISEGIAVATPPTEAKSYQIAAGATFSCSRDDVVLVGEIDITGTAGDAFYAVQF